MSKIEGLKNQQGIDYRLSPDNPGRDDEPPISESGEDDHYVEPCSCGLWVCPICRPTNPSAAILPATVSAGDREPGRNEMRSRKGDFDVRSGTTPSKAVVEGDNPALATPRHPIAAVEYDVWVRGQACPDCGEKELHMHKQGCSKIYTPIAAGEEHGNQTEGDCYCCNYDTPGKVDPLCPIHSPADPPIEKERDDDRVRPNQSIAPKSVEAGSADGKATQARAEAARNADQKEAAKVLRPDMGPPIEKLIERLERGTLQTYPDSNGHTANSTMLKAAAALQSLAEREQLLSERHKTDSDKIDALRADKADTIKQSDAVCDSYATENQQFHDKIIELQAALAAKDEALEKIWKAARDNEHPDDGGSVCNSDFAEMARAALRSLAGEKATLTDSVWVMGERCAAKDAEIEQLKHEVRTMANNVKMVMAAGEKEEARLHGIIKAIKG